MLPSIRHLLLNTPVAPRSLLDNLALWWDFNESSGNRIDLVSGFTATDSGSVTRTTGPSSQLPYAAQFAKTGSKHFSCVDNYDTRISEVAAFATSWTGACWYKTPTVGSADDILGKGSYEYLLDLTGTPSFRLILNNQSVTTFTPASNTWYCLFFGYNISTGKAFLQINDNAEVVSSGTCTVLVPSATMYLGRSVNNRYTNGAMAAMGVWKKYLSTAERLWLYNGGNGRNYPFGAAPYPVVEIIAPKQYQVAQTTSTTGSIPITGAVRHVASDIEASFNGGPYSSLVSAQKGLFTQSLTSQNNGQGNLTLRVTSNGDSVFRSIVGLGDIFVIAGQSNASGRATNPQAYSHTTLKATAFGNNYAWQDMPTSLDNNTGQIDSVSSDTGSTYGVWGPVATSYLSARSAPCAFVPCAKGGTTISQWQPGANHQDRTTLYGSMVFRALQTGAKAILWWQGEQDAFAGTSTGTYQTSMDAIITALATDLPGVDFIPAKLHLGNTYSDGNAGNIQTAIANIWAGGYTNVKSGPDLSALRSDSGDHFTLDASISTVATAWWNAIKAAYSW